ncbi:MAG: hypothetical protein ABIO63_08985 [Casimicrobiaceae bacterium]
MIDEIKVKRHADKLLAKANTHSVFLDDVQCARYRVVSGGKVKVGGNEYVVNVFSNGEAGCNCDWALKRPAVMMDNKGATACSHTIAVFQFIAQGEGRRVSAWSSEEQAERQHRPITNLNDGVVLTERKIAKRYTQSTFFVIVDRTNQ